MDAGLAREVGEASALLGMVAHMQGRWREVFRDEFLDSIRTPHFAPFIFDAHLCLAEFSLHGVTAHEESATFARELLGIARDASVIPAEAVALLMLGEAELLSGDLERAKADLTRAATLLGESRLVSGSCLATERLAEALTAGGRRWQARRLLSRALRQADDSPLAPHLVVRVRGAMITAAPDGGAQTEARAADEALSGRELCDPCSMGYRVAAAAAWARGGDLERARSHLDDAERVAGMWQGGPWQAAVWEARGVLRVAEGALDQAAALFREAADLFAQTGRPLDAARCRALLPA
jgi:tetratricopeptide (TPR) repeat protein